MMDAPEASHWRSRCESGNCVEVLIGPARVVIRSSVHRDGPWVEVESGDWMAFIAQVKGAQLDSRSSSGAERWSTS